MWLELCQLCPISALSYTSVARDIWALKCRLDNEAPESYVGSWFNFLCLCPVFLVWWGFMHENDLKMGLTHFYQLCLVAWQPGKSRSSRVKRVSCSAEQWGAQSDAGWSKNPEIPMLHIIWCSWSLTSETCALMQCQVISHGHLSFACVHMGSDVSASFCRFVIW